MANQNPYINEGKTTQWNISVVICDRYSVTVTLVMVTLQHNQ